MEAEKRPPLRILYILNSAGGGATQGILELLRALPRTDYEAFLVVPNEPNDHQYKFFSPLAKKHFVVPMVWWNFKAEEALVWALFFLARGWLKTLGHLLPVWQLCHIIRQEKIDIVYTNTAMILDGALAARLCGIPHLWHIKEWIGYQARVRFLLPDKLLVKVITGLSARVIVMTHFIGDIFARNGMTKNLQVIHDGVDLDDFQSPDSGLALRAKLGIPPDHFLIGMSASLSSTWKRHDLFIEIASLVAARLPNASFVAFGSTPRQYRNPAYNRPWRYYQLLQAKVKTINLESRFYWAGFCDNIPAMMNALDVLVHPCETEPFGRVAIEAMAARRPVVGPHQGGIAESVIHKKTGLLVEPGNPQAFADAVIMLHNDLSLRTALAAQGRGVVTESFSIQKHVTEMCQLYQSLHRKTKMRDF